MITSDNEMSRVFDPRGDRSRGRFERGDQPLDASGGRQGRQRAVHHHRYPNSGNPPGASSIGYGIVNRARRACRSTGWIELALDVVSVASAPRRAHRVMLSGFRVVSKPFGSENPDKVADQVAVVEVVPDEYLGVEAGRSKIG